MKKYTLMTIGVLMCLCVTLSLSLVAIKFSSYSNHVDKEDVDIRVTDFDSLNYMNAFDVADFSGSEVNTIDINAKKYTTNAITITDSDFRISDDLSRKIYNTIQSYGIANSFYIVSLDDGMTVGYNVDRGYETASSIKAPFALWVYEEIAKGNIDPNQKITYEQKHYSSGTGVVKNAPFGTEFTVRDLVYYSLSESDNSAHIMLHKTFGVNGYNEMLRNLGAKQLYLTVANPWGYTTPRSSALVWQEIYNFSIKEEEGVTFLNILCNGKYNYYKEIMPDIPSASKAGFAYKDVIETGIVFGDHPYIAIAVANKGGNIGAYTQVLKLIGHMNDIMVEYDEYLNSK